MAQALPHADAAQLLGRLYGALDERNYEQVADCFVPRCDWHRQGQVLRNREEIVAALAQRSPTLVVHHLATNCVLAPREEGCVAVRYLLTVFQADSAGSSGALTTGAPQVGFADAELVLHEGVWLFASMKMRPPTFKAVLHPAARL